MEKEKEVAEFKVGDEVLDIRLPKDEIRTGTVFLIEDGVIHVWYSTPQDIVKYGIRNWSISDIRKLSKLEKALK